MAAELKTKLGVEVFQAGTWNKEAYTVEDLDEMVKAFNEMQATWQPPLKLGHNDEQGLLQDDGLPAAGWIGRLYRQGEKLLADFIDIPSKIYELLENKAYKKVSSEIYWNIEINGILYRRMLAGVALLGADMPAVTTLNDILSLYSGRKDGKKCFANTEIQPTIKTHTHEVQGGDHMTAEQIKELQDKVKALESQNAEIADLQKFKTEQEAKNAELEKENAKLKADAEDKGFDAQVSEFAADGAISPAMKPYVKALIGPEKKEYSVGDKKLSRADALKETLKLHAEFLKLNTKEKTKAGGEDVDTEEKDLNAKIEKYCADNKVSYKEGYKAVTKGLKLPAKKIADESK